MPDAFRGVKCPRRTSRGYTRLGTFAPPPRLQHPLKGESSRNVVDLALRLDPGQQVARIVRGGGVGLGLTLHKAHLVHEPDGRRWKAKKVFRNEGLCLLGLNLGVVSSRVGGHGGAVSFRDR